MKRLLQTAARAERLSKQLAEVRAQLRTDIRAVSDAGESVSEIARRLGVSRSRVQQLLRH